MMTLQGVTRFFGTVRDFVKSKIKNPGEVVKVPSSMFSISEASSERIDVYFKKTFGRGLVLNLTFSDESGSKPFGVFVAKSVLITQKGRNLIGSVILGDRGEGMVTGLIDSVLPFSFCLNPRYWGAQLWLLNLLCELYEKSKNTSWVVSLDELFFILEDETDTDSLILYYPFSIPMSPAKSEESDKEKGTKEREEKGENQEVTEG